MSLLYGAGGTLENDMDDLTKDVWRKPMEKLKEAYDAGVIAPMDVDGEQRSVPARPCSRSLARGRRAICPTPWAPTRSRRPTPCSTAPTIR